MEHFPLFFTLQLMILLLLSHYRIIVIAAIIEEAASCQNKCGSLQVNYPLGTGSGCGSPLFNPYVSCAGGGDKLLLTTHTGSYPITSISYSTSSLTITPPSMSTCNSMQSSPNFGLDWPSPFQLGPSTFILLSCPPPTSSLTIKGTPICDDTVNSHLCGLIHTCPAMVSLGLSIFAPTNTCCVYSPANLNSMGDLDLKSLKCASYVSVVSLGDVPTDPSSWVYGITLKYNQVGVDNSNIATRCEACRKSDGICGYAPPRNNFLCVCKSGVNSSTDCYNQLPAPFWSSNSFQLIRPSDYHYVMTMKSLQVDRPQKPGSDYNGVERVNDQSTVIPVPNKRVNITEKFNEYERSWFPTQTPTDVIIQVEDVNFYVHKLPLISRSEYLSQLNRRSHSSDNGYDFKLDNFPGGVETFETVLKFCYGLPVDLTPTNIATLRCAAEFLQMTEEYEESNLIAKTEAFLTFIVLSSWRDSITVVKSCESLSPWAENLQIVRRCSDSIASKIIRRNSMCNETENDERWYFDDVSGLRIDHFVRIITAIKAKGTKPEVIGACIMHYAEKWLPSTDAELKSQINRYGINELHMSIFSRRKEEGTKGRNKDHKRMIEVLVSILPPQREAVSCKFLLWMLKMGLVYLATPALVSELEKRVGMVLEDATVNDLLIPTYNNGTERKAGSPSCEDSSMQNVDIVQRMVEYFLMHEQQQQQQLCGNLNVGKLLDGYLAEVARDPNLSIFKFQALAEVLPQNSRICHDGLYRAIDTYLKTHPTLTEHDRRRLCKAMDCDKLSLDACMHAAQNDRLPLRTVMQVLFSEQVKMRAAMKENEPKQHEIVFEQDGRLSTKKEIKTIMCELQKIRTQMAELQHDYSDLQREFDKLNKQKSISGWSSGWKKLKNSTLFYAKTNGVDGEEVHPGQTPASCKSHRNRSQSIS